jgi:hypothetical protein
MSDRESLEAVAAQLALGPAVPVPLQRAVVAALAWVDALAREAAEGTPPRGRPRG